MTRFIISLGFMYGSYHQAAGLSETLASVRFEVLTAALVQTEVSSDVRLCFA